MTHSLHPSSKHLIGCNKHDADDECNGEGTDQALTHTRVFDLLHWACCEDKERQSEIKFLNPMHNVMHTYTHSVCIKAGTCLDELKSIVDLESNKSYLNE